MPLNRATDNYSKLPDLNYYPCHVSWQGWDATTDVLSRNGWELSVEIDDIMSTAQTQIRLAMRHAGMKIVGISILSDWYGDMSKFARREVQYPISFRMQGISHDIIYQADRPPFSSFMPTSGSVKITNESYSLYRAPIFQAVTQRPQSEQILLDQADLTVVEHLEAIKRLQSPRQKELRKKYKKASATIIQQPVAEIIQFKVA